MGSSTNRNLQRNHDKAKGQRREAGAALGIQLAGKERPGNKARQLHLRTVTAFVHRTIEPSHPALMSDPKSDDPVMVPYMPHRSPRKVTPMVAAMVACHNELIKGPRHNRA